MANMTKNLSLREALELAVRQNSHDMLMTSEEIRLCEDALSVKQPVNMAILECDIKPHKLDFPLKDYKASISDGPLHATWIYNPHRLVHDLIAAVKYYATATQQQEPELMPVRWKLWLDLCTENPVQNSVTQPGRWKFVPMEPTSAQSKAAADAWLDCGSKLILNKATAALKAGIMAAPEPQIEKSND